MTTEACLIQGLGPGRFLNLGVINAPEVPDAQEVPDAPVGMTGEDLQGLDRQGSIKETVLLENARTSLVSLAFSACHLEPMNENLKKNLENLARSKQFLLSITAQPVNLVDSVSSPSKINVMPSKLSIE